MQFKNPEILYFLFFLIIPVIVHLFQLRKFKKEYFTNVKLLKEIETQTRKSSKIKKWLLLASRLLLLFFIILAFAQPFFKSNKENNKSNELVLILDTSYSMQAKGENGELLKRSIQEILEETPLDANFSLLTNTEFFWNADKTSIQKDIQNLKYTSQPFDLDYIINEIENKKPETKKDIIIITDAINLKLSTQTQEILKENKVYALIKKAENKNNVCIENVLLNQTNENFYELNVLLKSYGANNKDITLSLTNNDKTIAKSAVIFNANQATISLNIPKKAFYGKASIEDNSISYDNDFFITINAPEKINVLAIGSLENNRFLQRIFQENEFVFSQSNSINLSDKTLQTVNTIILNEIESIDNLSHQKLKLFYEQGGNIVIIPSKNQNQESLNNLLENTINCNLTNVNTSSKKITEIVFNHPIYENVFEKKIANFQYPKVETSYNVNGNYLPILRYQDKEPFLFSASNKIGNLYVFTAPLHHQNSNFTESPLVVPTFYNMAKGKQQTGFNTFTLSQSNVLVINKSLNKDQVLSVEKNDYSFIPMQQILNNKCKLVFDDYLEQSGNFDIKNKSEIIDRISFNYPRTESDLQNINSDILSAYTNINSLPTAFNEIESYKSSNNLWKWFIWAALLFLLAELFIQKYVK